MIPFLAAPLAGKALGALQAIGIKGAIMMALAGYVLFLRGCTIPGLEKDLSGAQIENAQLDAAVANLEKANDAWAAQAATQNAAVEALRVDLAAAQANASRFESDVTEARAANARNTARLSSRPKEANICATMQSDLSAWHLPRVEQRQPEP